MINNSGVSKDQIGYSVIRKTQDCTNKMKLMNELERLILPGLSKKRCCFLQWGYCNRNKNEHRMEKGFNKASALVVFMG